MSCMPRLLSAVFGALALILSVIVIGAAPASAASARHWTLSGVTFDDGGTLSGTLLIGNDGTLLSVDVTTSGGDTGTYGTYNYTDADPKQRIFGGWSVQRGLTSQYLELYLPDTSTANQGDTLTLPGQGWECMNCSPVRYITGGSIVAGGAVDLDAPVITPSVDPSSPDGANGWYTGNPTVSFAVNDPDSQIVDQSGCGDHTVSADTTGTTFTCQATSDGGTRTVDVTIKRDATAPVIAPTVSPKRVLLHGPIQAKLYASDATSGVAGSGCTGLSTASAGKRSAVCDATDQAGNETSAPLPYTVQYVMTRLRGTDGWKVGDQVRVAMRLTDAAGEPISNKQAAGLGCRVKLHQSGAQHQRACLTYHRANHTFRTTWTLGKHIGASKVTVSVGYAGSSVKTIRTTSARIAGPAAS